MKNKYILFLMIFLCQQIKTSGQSDISLLQTEISFNYSETSLYYILNDIQEKYKINFYYSNNLIPLDYLVSIEVKKQPLGKVLDLIFKGTPIRYKAVGDQIVLIKEIKEDTQTNRSKPPSAAIKKDTASRTVNKKIPDGTLPSEFKNGNMKNIREWKRSHKNIKPKIGNKSNKDSTHLQSDTLLNNKQSVVAEKTALKEAWLKKKGFKNFTLDFHLTLGSSFRKLTSDNKEGTDIIKKRNIERAKTAFISEIYCSYNFATYFSIRGGLGYMNLGERGNYKDSSGYTNSFSYLTIPIGASYSYRLKDLTFKAGLDLIPSILLGKGNELQYEKIGKLPKQTISNRNTNLAYSLYLEGDYRIKKMIFCLGVNYRQFFYSAYISSSALKETNYLTGIYAGLKYQF
jgi:hypothetical protein